MDLFRAEVYESRRFRLHGDVMLSGTTSNWALVGLLLVIVISAGIWVVSGRYARTETAIGYITPDGAMTKIVATRPGVISRISIEEGDTVKAGQPLATVLVEQGSSDRSDPAAEDLISIDKQHGLLNQQIALSHKTQAYEADKLAAAIVQTREQLQALDSQVTSQMRIVQSARDSYEPLTEAANEGYVSKIQFEAQRQQYLSAQVQLDQLQSQRAQLASQLRQTEVALSELPKQTASKVTDFMSSQSELSIKRIDIENERSYLITAPFSGRISNLSVSEGSAVSAQDNVLSIVDDKAKMHAEIYAPSRAIGFASVGQEVRLMYDAFPYQRFGSFGGHITSISQTILAPNDVDASIKAQIKEPVYRIEVALDNQTVSAFGERIPMQAGMTLSANIVLDRRSFLDWLLEPINAIRNRV